MTPEQVQLVQQNFAKVAPISEQAAVLFYGRLFEVAPSVRAMFPDDMAAQEIDGDLDRCQRHAVRLHDFKSLRQGELPSEDTP